jgi:adenine-specific DNA-methyltransferase
MAYRYIGNKSRLAGLLLQLAGAHVRPGATVADPMCGTASFSFALRAAGYRVLASDLMTFARHHAVVRLKLARAPAFAALGAGGYGAVLERLNALPGASGLMAREYSPGGAPRGGQPPRGYLTEANAARLDAMLAAVAGWQAAGRLTDEEHALLRHDLVLAVNRVANIAGTYGHFWSKWTDASLQPIRLRPSQFFALRTDHEVRQGRAEDVAAALACDLCYLDPPYTKRQYAANYHLIETVARGDEPEAIGVSGLRPWRDQYSDFCSKLRIRDAFGAILRGADCPRYLVSYSEDGLLARDELAAFLALHGSVVCFEFEFPRFRSNQSPLGRTLKEYVFALDRAGAAGSVEVRALAPPALPLAA